MMLRVMKFTIAESAGGKLIRILKLVREFSSDCVNVTNHHEYFIYNAV